MTLTIKTALSLQNALQRLESPAAPGKSEFAFPGKVILAIARNLRLLKPISDDLEATRLALIKQFTPAGAAGVPEDKIAAFRAEWEAILGTETDIELKTIAVDALNLDTNRIRSDILADLLDTIVTGDLEDKRSPVPTAN